MNRSDLRKTLDVPYDAALTRVPEALATEGFGVLTRIDMKETLHKKLGVDLRPYTILGACNPPLAHRAIAAELEVGLMLPCNVIVYADGPERTTVVAVDPLATIAADHPDLRPIAAEVHDKLARALARL